MFKVLALSEYTFLRLLFDLDVLEDKNYKINYCITVDVDENTKEKIESELDFISKI